MDTKLRHWITLPTESTPVWLNDHAFAYVRHDELGATIWQHNLETGQKIKRTHDDTPIWTLYSQPETGDLFWQFDATGHECENIYRLQQEADAPERLTTHDQVRHLFGGVSPDGRRLAFASNARTSETFDIRTLDLITGEEKIVKQHADHYNWPAMDGLSPDGRYLLYNKLKGESDNALWLSDVATGESYRVPDDDLVSAETSPAWRHDSSGFFLLSDRSGEFLTVHYYDLATKRLTPVLDYGWDVQSMGISYDDRFLYVLVNEEGYSVLHIHDLKNDLAEMDLPPLPQAVIAEYQRASWSPGAHRLLFTLTSGTRPQAIWCLDVAAQTCTPVSDDPLNDDDRQTLVEPTLHRYESFDGLSVPYWLYTPKDAGDGPFPVVIEIHGGPEGQEVPAFNPFIQYLVSENFAVVTPNVRGSTGYGKTYTHLDDVEKRLDSVHDIESLVHHLIETKVADKDSLAVTGTSYGGFMTLSCAARYPDLWAAAISTVGMYNLVTFLENTAEYRRVHRESEYGSLAHHRDILLQVSPAAKINDITCPMMIVQGKNDPRVPVSEAEQAVAALRERGRHVDYLCYDDEGHGISKLKNKLDCYPKMASFLKEHLGAHGD